MMSLCIVSDVLTEKEFSTIVLFENGTLFDSQNPTHIFTFQNCLPIITLSHWMNVIVKK